MKPLCVVIGLLLIALPARGLEVDARALGFTYQLPTGWKVLRKPTVHTKGLVAVSQDGKARIAVLFVTNFLGNVGDFHYAAVNGASSRAGSKFQLIDKSVFKTASNKAGLRTLARVTTKDGKASNQSFYSFEIQFPEFLLVECTAPPDGSFDATIESIMKSFRITH